MPEFLSCIDHEYPLKESAVAGWILVVLTMNMCILCQRLVCILESVNGSMALHVWHRW